MAWELWLYWWLRGDHDHGRRFAETALHHAADLPDDVHARAALAAATMAFAMDDVPAAGGWWARSHEHAGDDPAILSNAVAGEGLVALVDGDLALARDRFEAARHHAQVGGPEVQWTWGLAHVWLGTVALLEGDADEAVRLIEAGLDSARSREDRLSSYIALYNLFQVELGRGDHDAARRHLEESTRLSLETGDQANLAYLLDAGAVLAAASDQHARVPLLLGAAQAIREAQGAQGYGYYRPDPAAITAAADDARSHLGRRPLRRRPRHRARVHRRPGRRDAARPRRGRGLTRPDPVHRSYTCGCPWSTTSYGAEGGGTARTRAPPPEEPQMSTTLDPSTASGPHRDASTDAPTRPPGRGWVLAGLGAGLAGIASVVASGMVDAVYDPATAGDAEAITDGHRGAGAADPDLPHRDDGLLRPAGRLRGRPAPPPAATHARPTASCREWRRSGW